MEIENKITISIDAQEAISILSFLREYINDDTPDDYMFSHIKECVNNFETEVALRLDDEHWEYIEFSTEMNELIGKVPPVRKRN